MPKGPTPISIIVCRAPDGSYTGVLREGSNYNYDDLEMNVRRWPNRIAAWLGLRSLLRARWPAMATLGLIEVWYDYHPKPKGVA